MDIRNAARHGRHGDDRLVHMSQEELHALSALGGRPITTNPHTGLAEAFGFKDVLKIAGPIVGAVLGGPLGAAAGISATAGAALGAGAGSLLSGSKPKDALMSAGLSLVGSSLFGAPGGDVGEGSGLTSGADAQGPVDSAGDSVSTPSILDSIGDSLTSTKTLAPLAATAMLGSGSVSPDVPAQAASQAPSDDNNPYFGNPLQRAYLGPNTSMRYGRDGGERTYFDSNELGMAQGGLTNELQGQPPPFEGHGHLDGDTAGRDDKIPAMLSDGEYVMDAATTSLLGGGNNKAGAKMFDGLRKAIRQQTIGTDKQPKAIGKNFLAKHLGLPHFDEGGSDDGDSGDTGDSADDASGNTGDDAEGSVGGEEGSEGSDLGDTAEEASGMTGPDASGSVGESWGSDNTMDNRSLGQKGLDALGFAVQDKVNGFLDNPVASLADLVASQVPGLGMVNSLSGFLGGPTIGGVLGNVSKGQPGFGNYQDVQYGSPQGDPFGGDNPYKDPNLANPLSQVANGTAGNNWHYGNSRFQLGGRV